MVVVLLGGELLQELDEFPRQGGEFASADMLDGNGAQQFGGEWNRGEDSVFDLPEDGFGGQQGEGAGCGDAVFDRVNVVEGLADIDVNAVVSEVFEDLQGNGQVGVEVDDVGAIELGGADAAQIGERVIGFADEGHGFGPQGDGGQATPMFGVGEDAEIALFAFDPRVDLFGLEVIDADFGVGMIFLEEGLGAAEENDSCAVNCGDPEVSAQFRRMGGDVLFEAFIPAEDFPAAIEIDVTGLCELEGAGGAVDELNAEFTFDRGDSLRCCGLCNTVGGRGPGEISECGDIAKQFNPIHAH